MPFFAYKARNSRGELVEGVLEEVDSSAVANHLFNAGITPIDIVPTKKSFSLSGDAGWWERFTERKIRSLDVQLFSRQIFSLLKAGVPILRALAGLQVSATNKAFGRVLQDVRESLEAGRDLSTSMRRHPKVFSPFYLSMVSVGEMTGHMENIFLRLFDHLEFEREMKQRVKSALRYPIFVVVAIVLAIVIINIWVIPAFAKVFAGFRAELPLMTRILLNTSNFMLSYWPILLGLAIGVAALFGMFISSPQGRYKWDRFKLRIPIMGKIMLRASLARFARSFALSTRSGVPLVQGLYVVAQTVGNTYITSRIEQMRDGVERGESITRTAITAGVFTPIVTQMIAVGEETGAIDDLMDEIGDMYEREVDYELKTLAAQIEPVLIVVLGILVLILALGVFLPIWDLGQAALKR